MINTLHSNYINYIDHNELKINDIIDVDIKKYLSVSKFYYHKCLYQYPDEENKLLMIKLPFIKLLKNPFKNSNENQNQITIDLDHAQHLDIIISLYQYDLYIEKLVNTLNDKFICLSKLVSNRNCKDASLVSLTEQLRPIKCKFIYNKTDSLIKTKIINYNVSKKYPKIEILNSIKRDDLNRILYKNKEIRMMVTPITWFDYKNKRYGSYLQIQKMEVKFNGASIKSKFNEDQIIVDKIIHKITI